MEKQLIKDLIQEAWNEGDSNSKDRFGDFLNRAAHKLSDTTREWKTLKEVNMNKPTENEIKRFWEGYGFKKQTLEDLPVHFRHEGNLGWRYPFNSLGVADVRKNLPDIDLNNLFKYAVPKLGINDEVIIRWSPVSGHRDYMAEVMLWRESGEHKHHCWTISEDPALALFWAIYKVIEGES